MEYLPHVITVVLAVGGSLFWGRIRFERFESKDRQREQDWIEWRARLEERIERIDNRLRLHEEHCADRWNAHMKDFGQLRGAVSRRDDDR